MKLLLPLAALFVLTACGGGSGEAGSPNSQVAVKAPLKITAMQSTTCGGSVAATKAELFVYDNNWNITGRYKAGADGSFTLATEAKLLNFSVVHNLGDSISPKIFQQVFSQVEPGDFGLVYLGETSDNCECAQATANIAKVNSSTLQFMDVANDTLYPKAAKISSNTATFELCREKGKEWPQLAITARTTDYQWIFATLKDYQPNQQLLINLDKEVSALPFNSNNLAATMSSYYYAKDVSFRGATPKYDTPVMINGLANVRYVSHMATVQKSSYDSYGRKANLSVGNSLLQKAGDSRALNFMLPEWSRMEAFLATANKDWLNYNKGIQYDYTNFSEFTAITAELSLQVSTQGFIELNFIGPLKGKFPASLLPSGYLNSDVAEQAVFKHLNIKLNHLSTASDVTSYTKQDMKMYAPLVSKKERDGDYTYLSFFVY